MKPKVVVIGAGSYFFGRPSIWNMVTSPVLRTGTLALVDTNSGAAATMENLACRAVEAAGVSTTIEASTDRREVLADADFVVFSFSERNAYYRGVDTRISAKYDVRMCSGDTIGPGGIFRALREVPHALAMAEDVHRLCPNAWIINFVNPATVIGIALMRYAPNVKSFALCDGLHEPYRRLQWLKMAGILDEDQPTVPPEVEQKLDIRVAGVNHFTWMTRFIYDGRDYLPTLYDRFEEHSKRELADVEERLKGGVNMSDNNAHAKAMFNSTYGAELYRLFGAFPTCVAHTKEYVPYYQGHGTTPVFPEPLSLFDADQRSGEMAETWRETERYASGELPIEEFLKGGRGDHATDVIESMWGDMGKSFFINTSNNGAVTNMPDDAYLELRCDLDMHGPRPQPVGEFPRGILGLQHQVLDTHELTAQAAHTCDRNLLLRALAVDPIVNNLGDARHIMDELLEAERDALPDGWYQ